MNKELSEFQTLVWIASHTIHALSEGIRTAVVMRDEEYAVRYLRQLIDVSQELLSEASS